MEATTIKIYPQTKHALDGLKKEQESYDEIISKLIARERKKNLVRELKEGYLSQREQDEKIAKEWDAASDVD